MRVASAAVGARCRACNQRITVLAAAARRLRLGCSVKVRSVLLTPDDPAAVLPGPGPFTVHLLPSLLTMYGEY